VGGGGGMFACADEVLDLGHGLVDHRDLLFRLVLVDRIGAWT
jgi:hypothetical protein